MEPMAGPPIADRGATARSADREATGPPAGRPAARPGDIAAACTAAITGDIMAAPITIRPITAVLSLPAPWPARRWAPPPPPPMRRRATATIRRLTTTLRRTDASGVIRGRRRFSSRLCGTVLGFTDG